MMLRDALRVSGRGLAVTAASAAWAGITLLTFLVARHDWTIVAVSVGVAALLFALPAVREQRTIFGIVAVGVVGGLLALELGLRLSLFGIDAIVHPSHYGAYSALLETGVVSPVADARLGFGLPPNYNGYVMGAPFKTSGQGFRTATFSETPAAGTSRALVFGASIAMGAGVTQDHTYTAGLERELTTRLARPVEALDLAVPAYSPAKIFHLAKTLAPTLHPQVVILELPVGALNATRSEPEVQVGRRAPLPVSTVERYSFAATALYPPANLRDRLSALVSRIPGFGRTTRAAPSPTPAPRSGALIEEELTQLTALARVNGFRVVVLLVRPMAAFAEPALEAAGRRQLRDICESRGAILVDTFPLFHPGELPDDFIIFPGDLHPNAAGHARFANALADVIEPILRASAR